MRTSDGPWILGARTRRLALLMLAAGGPACKAGGGDEAGAGDATTMTMMMTTTTGAPTTGDASETAGTSGTPTTAGPPDLPSPRACNGDAALCERRFDEVVFPCTHNAFAARDDGFAQINANQQHGVAQQLADGVRCMMLDVQDLDGETALCHGGCALGKLDHLEVLRDIEGFLADNPDEVLTIIYQDDIASDRIVADLEASGLSQRVYTRTPGEPWPTLAAMIDADTRLLVTAENGGPPPAWFHHVWDLTWDTPYTFHSIEEFSCALNRGEIGNELFLVNHWVSTMFDTPSQPDAKIANAYDVLHARAVQCQQEARQLPNFLAVDFYEQGDLFAAVRALNGLQ
ncbi:MAG TPA: hypothetical protein VGB85_16055 [Nannocystis sp.]